MDGSGSSNGANGGGECLRPMDAEQLREYGHRMVDFVADYYKSIETFPVLSQVQPGYLKELLPDTAPRKPDTLEALFDDIREKIVPGVTHWQSPNYFAYYPSNSSTAGFLGEMLSAAFNIVGFSWITSPAATELEVIVLDWFAKMLNLPSQFLSTALGGGVIQGTASEAVLVVLLAARDRTLRKHGKKYLEKLVVYASDQTHSSLQKACQIAGIFPENVRVVKADCNKNYAVAPEAVIDAISIDLSSGLIPFFICATVGTTSSSAVDPLPELGQIAKAHDMWLHVDAAYAGSACICPEYRHYLNGVEEADSFNMNAHKWFLTNFDCSLLWVKDRRYLIQSLSTNPEYLKNKASQANSVLDFKDWQIPLGRRFRSLKLWMVLRLYGVDNLQSYIRKHIELAKYFEQLVISDSRFEVVAPRTFSLVCFRLLPLACDQDNGHKLNYDLMDAANSSGKIFLSHTPGYLKKLLPDTAPSKPDTLEALFDDIREKIVPGVTHWQSPNYFSYYPSNSSTAGFLGEMLSAAFNIVGFSWITSPAATELEVIVLDWFAKMLNLPSQFLSSALGGGVIQGTASEAVLVVLLAARDRTLGKHGRTSLNKLVVYASDQTHSSLQKACQIAGIFPENVRLVKADCNQNYAVTPEAVIEAIATDLLSGLIPFFICATIGTTSSSAVDPLPKLGQIAKANDMWLHIDAAYAGSACICPEYRHHLNGVEEADSFNMNAHKWFLTNFDCSLLWVKDRSFLIQSLSTNPEFLKNKASEANSVIDFKDWQISLGRRFRSLKLWMVLRLYGVENLQSYIRKHIELAKYFEQLVIADSRFEVVTPRTFSLVCFRLLPLASDQDNGRKLNYDLMDAANSSGKIFLSHTVLSGKFILRFAVGAPLTEEEHVFAAWKLLQDLATEQLGSP